VLSNILTPEIPMPRIKRPRIASPDEVRITREANTAVIEFADSSIATTHLAIGPKMHGMTNTEILALFNEGLQATADWNAEHPYVAIEIPPGKAQIEYSAQCDQWAPAGMSYAVSSTRARIASP
jgi:hypothetical protein